MDEAAPRPGIWRRLAAVTALVLVVVVTALPAVAVVKDALTLVLQLVLLLVVTLTAWEALTRIGGRRWAALVIAAAAIVAIVILEVAREGSLVGMAVGEGTARSARFLRRRLTAAR